MAFDTSDAITVTDVRSRVHDLVEEQLQYRRAFMQMSAPASTDSSWDIPTDDDNLAEVEEIDEGSHYPADEESFSTVTANRRKFGQAIPVTDEAEMDNVFELASYLTDKMGRKFNEALDREAFNTLDGSLNSDSPVTNSGSSAGTLEYDDILGGARELGVDGYDPDLMIIEPQGEEALRTDADFTRDTEMGDAVVSEGQVERVAGMDVVVSNTGQMSNNDDAYLIDTNFYGAEVIWGDGLEMDEVERPLEDKTYLKGRTFRDWVALDSEAAIKVEA